MSTRYTLFLTLIVAALSLTGCKKDTRPIPHTLSGDELYKDYARQSRGYPMTARESSTVLARTDLKSTGNYTPSGWPKDGGNIRFIYGRSYYWAYINNPRNPRDEPTMYGPFDLP